MITVTRLEPSSSNMCEGCPSKATHRILVKKTKRETGELMKPVFAILTLCEMCCEELCGELPKLQKDYVEVQHDGEYK